MIPVAKDDGFGAWHPTVLTAWTRKTLDTKFATWPCGVAVWRDLHRMPQH